jgi:hypothetical protein
VPLDIKSLFYIPSQHLENFGMGRMDPGVSLYCRKVRPTLVSHGVHMPPPEQTPSARCRC